MKKATQCSLRAITLKCADPLADLSGIVESVGPDVTQFKAGDRVLGAADGIVSQKLDNGAYQTYTVVRASSASKIPSAIGLEQAAALPTGTVSLKNET